MWKSISITLFAAMSFVSIGYAQTVEEQIIEAIQSDDQQSLDSLLEQGPDLNWKNDRGVTPLLMAFLLSKTDVIDKLVANGADIDAELLAERGKCGFCHSDKAPGVSIGVNVPHLAGQHAAYTAKQLRDYQSKARSHHKMDSPVKALTEDIIVALADYYQNLPRGKNSLSAEPELLKTGENVYKKSCSSCHGLDGIDTVDTATPTIAGFHALYTSFQLKFFKEKQRTNDFGEKMRAILITDDEIKALSEYIQSLY